MAHACQLRSSPIPPKLCLFTTRSGRRAAMVAPASPGAMAQRAPPARLSAMSRELQRRAPCICKVAVHSCRALHLAAFARSLTASTP